MSNDSASGVDPDKVRDDSSSDEDDAMYEPDVPDVKPKMEEDKGRSRARRSSFDDHPNISEDNQVLELDEENRHWIEVVNKVAKDEANEEMRKMGLPTEFMNTPKKAKKMSYTCHLCRIENLSSLETLQSHIYGAPHKRKLKSRRVSNAYVVSKAPAMASTKKKKVHRRLHSLIRECKEPVLGLEYLEEYLPEADTEMPPSYFCTLCSKKGNPDGILNHIRGREHREASIRKKYPEHSKAVISPNLLLTLSSQYRENDADLKKVIKTIYSDNKYPWPPNEAPWSMGQRGSGIAPGLSGNRNEDKPEGNSDHKHEEEVVSKDKDQHAKSIVTRTLSEELSEPTSIEEVALYLEKAMKLLQLAMKSKPMGPDGPQFSSEAEQNMVTGVVASLMHRAKTQARFSMKEELSAGTTRKVKTEKDAAAARPRHEDRHDDNDQPSPSTSGCSSSSFHSNGRSSSHSPSPPKKIKTENDVDLRDRLGHRERNHEDRHDQREDRNYYSPQEDRGYEGWNSPRDHQGQDGRHFSPRDHQGQDDRHSSPRDDSNRYSPRDDRGCDGRHSPRDDPNRYSPRDDRGRDGRHSPRFDRVFDGRYLPHEDRGYGSHSSPPDNRSRYSPRFDCSRDGRFAAASDERRHDDEYDSRRPTPTSSNGYHRNGYHYNSGY